MNSVNYFKDMFESIPEYRKILLLIFLIQNDKDSLLEIGFSERDVNCSYTKYKNIPIGQHDEYLDLIKNEEESIIEKFLKK